MGLCRKVTANDCILLELHAVSSLTYLLMKIPKQNLWTLTFQILSVFLDLAILSRIYHPSSPQYSCNHCPLLLPIPLICNLEARSKNCNCKWSCPCFVFVSDSEPCSANEGAGVSPETSIHSGDELEGA
jgi:hypothetical protein